MKIQGNGNQINEIKLMLNSIDFKFKCITELNPCIIERKFEDSNIAKFIFDDSRELDDLIMMLMNFRDKAYGHIGKWE